MSAGGDKSQSLKDLKNHNGRPSPKIPSASAGTTANSAAPAAAPATSVSASPAFVLPKIEPGTSSSSTRLASFRTPRDLSMSGLNFPASFSASNLLLGPSKPKRVFAPNIAAKREKCDSKSSMGRSDRGRGRGGASERGGRGSRGGRGRGRGRGSKLVQMKGLWTEGVATAAVRNSSGGPSGFAGAGGSGMRRTTSGGAGGIGGGGGGSMKAEDGVMQRPVVTGENMVVDKDEEDQCLSMLLGEGDDDYEDDDESAEYYEHFCKPMCLALEQVKTEPPTDSASASPESTSADVAQLGDQRRIKVEPGEPPCLTNGHTPEMRNGEQPRVAEDSRENLTAGEPACQSLSIGDILRQNKRTMFLWQLPKTLPSIVSKDTPAPTARPGPSSGPAYGGDEAAAKKVSEYCTLSDLYPGKIGSVKVYKSGRAELCLGNYSLPIIMGCKKPHLEEVAHVSIDASSRTGKLAVLGHIEQTLQIRPHFDELVDLTRCRR